MYCKYHEGNWNSEESWENAMVKHLVSEIAEKIRTGDNRYYHESMPEGWQGPGALLGFPRLYRQQNFANLA